MLKDIAVNINGKLTADVRKHLCLIIEQEFNNKQSLFQLAREQEKEKVVNAYKQSIGFDKLLKEYERAKDREEKATADMKKAEKCITERGLDLQGRVGDEYRYDHVAGRNVRQYKVKELQEKLQVIEDNAPSSIHKSKLITRLMLSTNIGEANAVMFEVLGNGVIPSVDAKQITYTQE